MDITVSQPGGSSQVYRFTNGPVYIGRHRDCHVPLADGAVSRQHAVIYLTLEGQVILRDLDSANGTVVNGRPCREQALRHGDCLHIGPFRLDISLEEEPTQADTIAEDTAFEGDFQLRLISRDPLAHEGPDIHLPIGRVADFARACRALLVAEDLDQLLQTALVLLLQQFRASRVWCGVRATTEGRPACALGVSEQGHPVALADIQLQREVQHSLDTGCPLLIPTTAGDERVPVPCSALIAPLLCGPQCLGSVYLDRHAEWRPFCLADLDYLTFLALTTGVLLQDPAGRLRSRSSKSNS